MFDINSRIFLAEANTGYVDNNGEIINKKSMQSRPEYSLQLTPNENGIMVKRKTFEEIGCFNELLFFGAEGGELGLKAYYLRYYGVFVKNSVIFHPTSRGRKKQTLERQLRTVEAHCIARRCSWPLVPCYISIIRYLSECFLNIYRDTKRFSTATIVFPCAFRAIRVKIKKVNKCSIIRWFKYRKLSKQVIEIMPGNGFSY